MYDEVTMMLFSAHTRWSLAPLVLSSLCFAAPMNAAAQTATAHHHAAHRTTAKHAAAKPKAATCPGDPLPQMSALIPAITGCPATLYALRYVDTVPGAGAAAAPRKFLTVNYTGYLADGTKFDTSIGKQPITFPYGAHQVITGWDTGFEGMMVGGKRRLYIPYQLAYGEAGRPPVIPAKALLIFDVELLAVSDTPPAPQMPSPRPAPTQNPASGETAPAQGAQPAPTTAPASSAPAQTNPAQPPTSQTTSNPPKP